MAKSRSLGVVLIILGVLVNNYAYVTDIVRVIDGHLHPGGFVAGDFVLDDLVGSDAAKFNARGAADDTEFLIFADMIRVASGDAGFGR